MSTPEPARVFTSDGQEGTIEPSEAGSEHSRVKVGGKSFIVPNASLRQGADGNYFLPFAAQELDSAQVSELSESAVIPIIEERLKVETRKVDTAVVQIHKHVEEHQQVVDELLMEEQVEVQRVPVNRLLTEPELPREEEGVTIIPVMEEILYVEKRLVLKEEIRITKRRTERHEPQHVTLRTERVEIERRPVEQSP